MENRPLEYDYTVTKMFMFTTVVLGIVGMLVGVVLAWQLAFPGVNLILGEGLAEYTNFSRLRPLLTDAVTYGFTLSAIFASWYYIGQRILKVSMAESPFLMFIGKLHFWLYLIIVVFVVGTLLMGITTSREYAEFEWPIDIGVVVIWVLWGVSMFGLIGIRREKSLYISMWYFIACFLAVAMLYLLTTWKYRRTLLQVSVPYGTRYQCIPVRMTHWFSGGSVTMLWHSYLLRRSLR